MALKFVQTRGKYPGLGIFRCEEGKPPRRIGSCYGEDDGLRFRADGASLERWSMEELREIAEHMEKYVP